MHTDEYYMKEALLEAEASLRQGLLPVGAVFVRGGEIVHRTRKFGAKHPLFDHAERNGFEEYLKPGVKDASDITVYVTLEPCTACLGLMLAAKVVRIVYALDDPYGGGVLSLRPDALPIRHRAQHPFILPNILRNESKALMKEFFEANDGEFWKNKENPLVRLCLGEQT
jgi:tRNA(adenine34) deaminase